MKSIVSNLEKIDHVLNGIVLCVAKQIIVFQQTTDGKIYEAEIGDMN